ncbi:MAG: DUF512 domain-containing protein [Clostridia bacterium]|nr:DUF512 domain-containing protein [Clostridia bacterium]
MATITSIEKNSPFYGKLKSGDILLSINGIKIHDILDYMYCAADEKLTFTVDRQGETVSCTAKCNGYTGVNFDTYLMDKERSCKNKCIFCFIDQLPKGMRSTVYYKDDDFRLSLLYGNYVTLTNATEEDIDRIIRLKISPLNVSVHTTNDELRVKMMKNPNAKGIMPLLRKLTDAGINLRCQIVLCKGWNDGEELLRTMNDLSSLYPNVSSVSIVPLGMTGHREGLCKLELFSKEECSCVIDTVSAFGDKCVEEFGTRLFYESDEFYIKSERELPESDYYEEFEQIENGVGITSLFIEDFLYAIDELPEKNGSAEVSWVTSKSMENIIPSLINKVNEKLPNLKINLYPIANKFFGETITVTGLVTGGDIISQLKDKPLGKKLIIPKVMLRDDVFLDDVSVSDIEKELNTEAVILEEPCDIVDFFESLI